MPFYSRPFQNPFDTPSDDLSSTGGFNQPFLNRMRGMYDFSNPMEDSPNMVKIGRNPSYLDYTPSTMLRKYLDYSQKAPNREDYQPDKWGTALATAAGALEGLRRGPSAGIKAASDVRDQPFEEAMGDYQRTLKGYQNALEAEQKEQNIRNMADWRNAQIGDKEEGRQIQWGNLGRQKQNDQNRFNINLGKLNLGELNLGEKQREFNITSKERGRHNLQEESAARTRAGAAVTSANASAARADLAANKPKKRQEAFNTMEDEKLAKQWAYEQFFTEQPAFNKFRGKGKGSLVAPDDPNVIKTQADKDGYAYMLKKMDAMKSNYLKQHPRYRQVEDTSSISNPSGELTVDY